MSAHPGSSTTQPKKSWFGRHSHLIGLVADILGIFTFLFLGPALPGWISLTGILAFSLVAVFAFHEFLNTNTTWFRPIARAGFVVGILGAVSSFVLLIAWFAVDRPSALGRFDKRSTSSANLVSTPEPGRLACDALLSFDTDADAVEVLFIVAQGDRSSISSLKVIGVRNDRQGRVQVRTNEDSYTPGLWVEPARQADSFTVALRAEKQSGVELDKLSVNTEYRYGTRTWWWETKRWLFKRFP
jgi:hypothetical protein